MLLRGTIGVLVKLNNDTLIVCAFGAFIVALNFAWLGIYDHKEVRRIRSIESNCRKACSEPKRSVIINIVEGKYDYSCVCGKTIDLGRARP